MADKRITELSLHTSLTLSDVIPIVSGNETKKTTYGSLYYAVREGLVSGSSQLTASYDERYALSGSGGGTIPAGTVSGSAQITSFGFVSGSFETTGRGILSGSISYTNLTNIPSSLVSGSSQLTSSFDGRYESQGRGIISSSQQLPAGLVSGSSQIVLGDVTNFTSYSSSVESKIQNFNSFTQSYYIDSASFATIGSNVFSGSQGISGSLYVSESLYVNNEIYLNGNKLFNYAQFSDTTTQSGSANTAYSMKFNTTDISHNISMVSGSRITVQNTGIYNLQFSTQLDNPSNTNEVVDIWIAVTGSNIPNSTTTVAINKAQAGNIGKTVAAWNYMIPLSASQYVELKWNTSGGNIILLSEDPHTNPDRPATPSIIATITQIA
jgi:hypothetical protein